MEGLQYLTARHSRIGVERIERKSYRPDRRLELARVHRFNRSVITIPIDRLELTMSPGLKKIMNSRR
jgi:hypothetical protein